jgi:hypothetical protein
MSTTVLPKDFRLDTKASKSQQIASIITAINSNKKLADINKRRYIDNLTTLQNLYNSYESNPNSQDVIIFNKANGLGQTQTSVKDFLSAPITDVFSSGMTVDAMKYSPKGKTSDNSGQKKLKDLISEGIAGGLTEEEATKKAKEKLKAGLEVTTIGTGTGTSRYNPATTGSFNPSTSDTTKRG